jgi:hypothetical protein
MKKAELQEHAVRLLTRLQEDPEFSLVYEDDELSAASRKTQLAVLELMTTAQITVTWPGLTHEWQIAGEPTDD